jgi:pyrimidine-specific ribonucleoside hydrolase
MSALPVILDVDTGIDDALALLLALRSPALEVRAITCVGGNHRVEPVVTNTLKVLDIVAAPPLPVAAGMTRPLVERAATPLLLHGQDGMADLDLPASLRQPASEHAVELLRKTLLASPTPVHLIGLAPLTNLAVLLRMYPAVRERIAGVTIMGGTFGAAGNTSPLAEFNIRCDPEAAAIVLESGLPIRLYPLDPFRQVRFRRHEIERLIASTDPAAHHAGRILRFSADFFQLDEALIGDAGAVATVIDPAGATVERYPITVELYGSATRGQTVFDRRSQSQRTHPDQWWETSPVEIEVISAVDVERYKHLFAHALGTPWP